MLTRAATEHALPTHVSMAVDVSTKYGKKSVTARGLDSKEKGVERVRNKLNQEKNKGQKGRPPSIGLGICEFQLSYFQMP